MNLLLAITYFKFSRNTTSATVQIPKWFSCFLIGYSVYAVYTLLGAFRGSIYWTEALFDVFKLFDFGALVLLFYLLFKQDNSLFLKIAEWITKLSLVFLSIGLIQYLIAILDNGFLLSNSDQMVGVFANKNIFSEICFSVLGFQLFAFLNSKKSMRYISATAIMGSILFIVLLLSRNVWLALSVAAFACFVVAIRQHQFREKLTSYIPSKLIFSIVILLMGLLFLYQFSDTQLGKHQLKEFYNHRNTEHERALIWGSSIQMIKEHPLLGIGTASWKVEVMKLQSLGIRGFSTFFQQPHNDYLWVLSEQGITGILLCSFWCIIIAITLLKLLFAKSENQTPYYILLFYLVGYMVISVFAFPRERIEHIVLLSIYVAWLFSFLPIDIQRGNKIPVLKIAYVACSIGFVGSIIGFNRVYAERNLVKLINLKNEKNWNELLMLYPNAQNLFYQYDGVATPICWYKGVAHFNQNNVTEAKNDFLQSLSLNPFHPFTLSNLGACEELQGNHSKAKEYLTKALQYSPGFADAVLNLAAIQHTEGNTMQAVETFATIADTSSSPRFETFREVLINAKIDSLKRMYDDETIRTVLESLKTRRDWQLALLKKSQYHHITFDLAVRKDVAYVIEQSSTPIENKETILKVLLKE
jgi:O-antigen ligase